MPLLRMMDCWFMYLSHPKWKIPSYLPVILRVLLTGFVGSACLYSVGCGGTTVSPPISAPPDASADAPPTVLPSVRKAVVRITVKSPGKSQIDGSGVLVSEDGTVLTAAQQQVSNC